MSSGQRSSNESRKTILDTKGTYTKRGRVATHAKRVNFISEDVEEMEILKMVLMMM
jgi:hypothetical protein